MLTNLPRQTLFRFFTHLLVRLLVVTSLPPSIQPYTALLPASMLWTLVRATQGADIGADEGVVTAYTYTPDDLLSTVTYPNGVVATHAYDNADRLTSLTNAGGGTTISSYAYNYTPNGNRASQVETNGGLVETTDYTYDDLNRLKTITYPTDTKYPIGRNVEYGYDLVGNRLRETEKDNAGTLLADKQGVFDALNRLTDLNDLVTPAQSIAFGYDANGNQISKTVAGVTTRYVYDLRDKLIQVDTEQGGAITGTLSRFAYDFAGRRIEKIGDGGIHRYVYDQTSLFAEYNDSRALIAKYDYSDRLVSLTHAIEGRRYFAFDALGSVVNLTTDSGAVAASYHWSAWGELRNPAELNASSNRFGFTGYEWDQETGLYNARARYYDPDTARFTSQDSYLGQIDDPPSLHRYFYANARPTYFVDPTGHASSIADAVESEKRRRASMQPTTIEMVGDESGVGIVDPSAPIYGTKRGTRGATPDELTPDQQQWLDQEIARRRQERAQEESSAAVTVQESHSIFDKYREKRERLKQWAERKAQQGADSLTHPVNNPDAEARKEELRQATAGTVAEHAGIALADRNIAQGVNETAIEGAGIAAREGTELGIQYVETEVGLRAAGVAIGGLRSVRRGLAGEEAVANEIGVARNAGPGRVTVPGTGRGGYRIPDFPPEVTLRVRGTVVEVKNVKNLSITPQLRDLARYAQARGATLEIFTNAPSPMSGQLRDLIAEKVVRIVPLPRR
jgi:RHS repeat-associated protein